MVLLELSGWLPVELGSTGRKLKFVLLHQLNQVFLAREHLFGRGRTPVFLNQVLESICCQFFKILQELAPGQFELPALLVLLLQCLLEEFKDAVTYSFQTFARSHH